MKDLLSILLDEDNTDPIVLSDKNGKTIAFEQIAIIPRGEGEDEVLYVILKPLDKVVGMQDDEAIVFKLDADKDGNVGLRVETDELTAIEVFNLYYDLYEEVRGKTAENRKRSGT